PIDHRDSGSGVSSEARALTITALGNPASAARDFVRPGHISPLLAKDGGVLRRAGHTEATIDLLRLAGKQPVGVLIEILSDSGRGMAQFEELVALSRKHAMPLISIEQLI